MLKLSQLHKAINGQTLLQVEQLTMSTAHSYGLVGEIGSGKSSFLRMIAGLDRPDTGEIHWHETLFFKPHNELPANQRKVGMVFQEHALWPHMSVQQHLQFAFSNRYPTTHRKVALSWQDISHSLALTTLHKRYPAQLSGGQKQRLGLARALCVQPQILLIDEGFNQQDERHRSEAWDVVQQYQQHSACLLICVSHYAVELQGRVDRLLRLHDHTLQLSDNTI